MLYMFGVNLPTNKRVVIGLTSIYGINRKTAEKICSQLGLNKTYRINQLTTTQIARLTKIIEQKYIIGGDLRKEINSNIKRLISINCYKGHRHRASLPVNGQRTSTNAKTQKKLGNRVSSKSL